MKIVKLLAIESFVFTGLFIVIGISFSHSNMSIMESLILLPLGSAYLFGFVFITKFLIESLPKMLILKSIKRKGGFKFSFYIPYSLVGSLLWIIGSFLFNEFSYNQLKLPILYALLNIISVLLAILINYKYKFVQLTGDDL